MATRLYLHAATSTVSGTLPSTEQSSRTAAQNCDAQTVNRSMNTSVGVSQAVIQANTANATDRIVYVTKFVSLPLVTTSISANTWTYNFAYKINSVANQTAPVKEGATNPEYSNLPVTLYIWRPSTGAKVGNIYDQDTPGTTGEFFDCSKPASAPAEFAENGSLSGSAVTAAAGDVIVLEAWIYSTDSTARTNAINYYYDGTTVTTAVETVVSNHAAFLETPQALTFSGAGNNITKSLTETVTIGNTVPVRKKGAVKAQTDTITISSTPTRLATKARTLTETITINTPAPATVKAKNINKTLTETVTVGATTPTRTKGAVRPISQTVTINTPAPTYIQVPKRFRTSITETVSIASTVVRKSSKKRSLLN